MNVAGLLVLKSSKITVDFAIAVRKLDAMNGHRSSFAHEATFLVPRTLFIRQERKSWAALLQNGRLGLLMTSTRFTRPIYVRKLVAWVRL